MAEPTFSMTTTLPALASWSMVAAMVARGRPAAMAVVYKVARSNPGEERRERKLRSAARARCLMRGMVL